MKKQSGAAKQQADFDAKFAQYANQLSPQYKDQFKSNVKAPTQNQKVKQAVRNGRTVEVVTKGAGNKTGQVNVGKLLNEDVEIKEVPREIAVQISQARTEKKLTQEQLANKIQENITVIKNLESCTGIYNPKAVEKIERALGVKFTRSWKK